MELKNNWIPYVFLKLAHFLIFLNSEKVVSGSNLKQQMKKSDIGPSRRLIIDLLNRNFIER